MHHIYNEITNNEYNTGHALTLHSTRVWCISVILWRLRWFQSATDAVSTHAIISTDSLYMSCIDEKQAHDDSIDFAVAAAVAAVSDIRSYTSLSLIDPQYAKSHAPTPACVQRPENKRLVSGRRFEPCAAANRSGRALPTAHSCGDEVGGRLRPRPRPGDGRTDGRQSSITGCLAPISSSVCHVVSDART